LFEQNCSISVNGVRLTSQYDESVRFHINSYHLKQYMQNRRGWTESIWNEVDFYLFGMHLRRLPPKEQSTWIKVVHDQLPLGAHRIRQASVKDEALALCPCCKQAPESRSHFLSCSENPCFQSSLKTLQSNLSATNNLASTLIFSGIKHTLSNTIFPVHLVAPIQSALAAQARIGWQHSLMGFLSVEWRRLAGMNLSTLTNDEALGISSMRKVIHGIHSHVLWQWTSRNAALHESTDSLLVNIRSAEFAEIRALHGNPNRLLSADRHLCSRSLASLFRSSPSTRRRWLRLVKQSIEVRQSRITSFFPSE
jgi:hypothetical protein